jgi:AcrR family transcriptional regulator
MNMCSYRAAEGIESMSPRGKPIPEIRERLFRAGERVLVAGGPGAVSARAVADEAGVAVGLLYNHFEDLDEFLVELVLDRFRVQAEKTAELPALAGSRTVADNLADAGLALLESPGLAVAELARARQGLFARVSARLAEGSRGLGDVQGSIAAYLEEERRLGRLAADADPTAAALMLVGAVHHLLLLHGSELRAPRQTAERVATALVAGLGTGHDPR